MTRLDIDGKKEDGEDNSAPRVVFFRDASSTSGSKAQKLFARRAFYHCTESTRGKREGMQPVSPHASSRLFPLPLFIGVPSSLRPSCRMCIANTRVATRDAFPWIGLVIARLIFQSFFRGASAHWESARFSRGSCPAAFHRSSFVLRSAVCLQYAGRK